MCDNTTEVKPGKEVVACFMEEIYPKYKDDTMVDILLNNTSFVCPARYIPENKPQPKLAYRSY